MSMPCVLRATVLAACAAIAGCGPDSYNPGPETCDRSEEGNPPVLYTDGTTENGIYMTSDWDGQLLWFPGGMHYALEHDLPEEPRFFQAYLSFDRYGTSEDGDPGTIALASGTQVELVRFEEETEEETMVVHRRMVVRNADCVDYWLLVVAGTGAP
jgi:hypothetical protein